MKWYLKVLKNYVGFEGRAHRTEFWVFTLFNILIGAVLSLLDLAIFGKESVFGLYSLYSLGVFLPALAVAMRRLHDTNRSGFLILLSVLPVIGWIVLLIFFVQDGTKGPNRFGEDPKSLPEVF